LCHTSGGAATATRLQFVNSSTDDYQSINQQRIIDFLALGGVDSTFLLTKAQGGLTHGGGSQIVFGSDEYDALSTYLDLLSGGDNSGKSSGDFWQGVGLLDSKQTLRKAALIFGSRLPTEEEYVSVADNKDASLKAAIRSVMQGDGFHSFLAEGANDRLLTHKFLRTGNDFLDFNGSRIPEGATLQHLARKAGPEAEDEFYSSLKSPADRAFATAATELIAFVVENEKPYSEILTADYTMVNPSLSTFYRSSASFNNNDPYEMVPAKLQGFMLNDETFTSDYTETFGLEIHTEGPIITWPHAGILNDPAFLLRYPSTATNRNRARSRWTQYFFLDFDIEKSAARTNDPDALADTDNPTMKNPNCTVCHIPMDPVAGAFQNYGDIGFYRDQWGGNDSLPDTYKWPEEEESLYQEGDTWYRDMREPGFYGETVPDADSSLQWLADKIVNDDRFAVSAVKFWWPALIGTAPVYAPEISSDYDYQSKTAVYNAQSAYINNVADNLRSHMSLKDTFVDIAMSEWFRSSSMTEEAFALHASNRSGKGRLLSPELLDRKTKAVFGISWGEDYPEWDNYQRHTELLDKYLLTYGGIDSDGVIKRAEEMTSIMSQVALTHAAENACDIVVRDFIKEENEKLLFKGLTKFDSPSSIYNETFSLSNNGPSKSEASTIDVEVEEGSHILNISYLNDWADWEILHVDKNLMIDKVIIKQSDGDVLYEIEGGDINAEPDTHCAGPHNEDETGLDLNIWSGCDPVQVPFTVANSGTHTIEIWAYGGLHDEYDGHQRDDLDGQLDDFLMGISVTLEDYTSQSSPTILKIKNTIARIVEMSWGETLASDHEEIEAIYQLFINSWESKKTLDGWNNHIVEDGVNCNFPFWQYNRPEDDYDGWVLGDDPQSVMSAWRTVILYVMTDYRYLHE